MPAYTQSNRHLRIATPLGEDAILVLGLRGTEAISELFSFELDLIAPEDEPVDFSAILGQPALVEIDLPDRDGIRYFHGLIGRFTQIRTEKRFTHYRAELVPVLWLLTRRVQSRIFQHLTVKQILAIVLDTVPLKWTARGNFARRDYCTQYRESDYDFAKRLMEEEGIYYFFQHTADGHTLVLSDTPQGHDDVPGPTELIFRQAMAGESRDPFTVHGWEKSQEIRTGKFTLWDHNFELPHEHLDAEKEIAADVTVGTVTHKLRVGPTAELESYSYPGGYADWFDGIDRGGSEQASDLQHVFEQNRRLVGLRAQEEAASAVRIAGASYCAHLTSGHRFTLAEHADADGDYILTRVTHEAKTNGNFASGGDTVLGYSNEFVCLPAALAYRPARKTPRPTVQGTQTAIVVGPEGEEIFTDKYGRVKVQFHWDRAGKHDADSSCWVRVATIWAGKGWGVIHIPRIGHEVVVDFLEGNPDRPIVIGSVYNADHMPPGELPKEAMVSGLSSRSTPKAGAGNFNGMRANDTKGKEHLTVQAEYDQTSLVKHDEKHTVNNNRTITVDGTHTETIKKDTAITVAEGNYSHTVSAGTATIKVKGAVTEAFHATLDLTVTGAATHSFEAAYTEKVTGDRTTTVGGADKLTVTGAHTIEATGAIKISSKASIEISVGASVIKIGPAGIEIKSPKIDISGDAMVSVKGGVVKVNS